MNDKIERRCHDGRPLGARCASGTDVGSRNGEHPKKLVTRRRKEQYDRVLRRTIGVAEMRKLGLDGPPPVARTSPQKPALSAEARAAHAKALRTARAFDAPKGPAKTPRKKRKPDVVKRLKLRRERRTEARWARLAREAVSP